ncbi:hypothetical protein [Streptomyces gibsoniae]|uniref:Transposase n=1 Tax=Streptomyces gibsoniae TaxID=3075529 RepID=A0ABU2TZJ7_9ACTN|nr:hypothetical protein [Streptomyces sp. DSM 41699]MDT0466403.1 hypothetical protein [Streptomyces sp. DSM 41699]
MPLKLGIGPGVSVTSYTQRHVDGDHEGVWADLPRLGPIPDATAEDCAAVAAKTMQRASSHVVRLAEQLTDLGLVAGGELPTPPTAADHSELDALTGEIGALPAALDACLRHVGGVRFAGDRPAFERTPTSRPQRCGWCCDRKGSPARDARHGTSSTRSGAILKDTMVRAERAKHHKGNSAHHNEKPTGSQERPYGAVVVRAQPTGLDNKEPPGL